MLLEEITLVKQNIAITVQFNPKSEGQLYYILENGSYCNIEETTIDASAWSSSWKQVRKAYSVDTDADHIDLWIPATNAPGANPEMLRMGLCYYDDWYSA